jgi:hypothetical protein
MSKNSSHPNFIWDWKRRLLYAASPFNADAFNEPRPRLPLTRQLLPLLLPPLWPDLNSLPLPFSKFICLFLILNFKFKM